MVIDTEQGKSLLEALHNEETTLGQAMNRLKMVETEYDLASSRYAAIRDLVKLRLGASPYSALIQERYPTNSPPRAHQHRFLGMSPMDAAIELLEEAGNVHLSLDDLVKKMEEGGLEVVGTARAVNAGLMNRAGVAKDEAGRYYLDQTWPFAIKQKEEVSEG